MGRTYYDGVRRLLGGDGGDELFAGNERYITHQILGVYDNVPGFVRRRILEPLAFRFPAGEKIMPVRKLRSYIRQAKIPMPQQTARGAKRRVAVPKRKRRLRHSPIPSRSRETSPPAKSSTPSHRF